ncbi:MAG: NAD(P)-dependent oxidoreductase [Bacteroidota bacterium]
MIKIGLIKEGKIPADTRVPLIPTRAKQLMDDHHGFKVIAQSSDIRCFKDDEYKNLDISVKEDISECDVLLGVKEVPIKDLIPDKTYFFFSHTIKEQPYNRELLREILKKKITLIDYEVLTSQEGWRIIGFGRWAGIVGAYNGLLTYGKKHNLFQIRRANECFDYEDLKTEYPKIELPPVKIVLTGSGRVSRGAMEVLDDAGIRKVSPKEILNQSFDEPVYAQLFSYDYNLHKERIDFTEEDFIHNPDLFDPDFLKYTEVADILIAGSFWHPDSPVLFTKEDLQNEHFKTKVIADITCDIEGSIPTTLRSTVIADPFYDYDPDTYTETEAFSDINNVTVMAIDTLPNELPRNASENFGEDLASRVLPLLLGNDEEDVIGRATIAKDGALTEHFKYLESYVNE